MEIKSIETKNLSLLLRYGCCMDGITPAQGFGRAGCPDYQTSVVRIYILFTLLYGFEDFYFPNIILTNHIANCCVIVFIAFLVHQPPSPPAIPAPGDVCSLPREEGPCDTWMVRFFYDSGVGKCTDFWYGSCQGNSNNFASLEACQKKCGNLHAGPTSRRAI